jgi:Mitochondrial carrier protein
MVDPYIMAKIRMQWKPPKNTSKLSAQEQENVRYKSSIDILRKVYHAEGFKGWYKVSPSNLGHARSDYEGRVLPGDSVPGKRKAYFVHIPVL